MKVKKTYFNNFQIHLLMFIRTKVQKKISFSHKLKLSSVEKCLKLFYSQHLGTYSMFTWCLNEIMELYSAAVPQLDSLRRVCIRCSKSFRIPYSSNLKMYFVYHYAQCEIHLGKVRAALQRHLHTRFRHHSPLLVKEVNQFCKLFGGYDSCVRSVRLLLRKLANGCKQGRPFRFFQNRMGQISIPYPVPVALPKKSK